MYTREISAFLFLKGRIFFMGKTPLPCYQIGWVLFLALPQTGFVTPWKSLHLSDTVLWGFFSFVLWDGDKNMFQVQVRRLNIHSPPPLSSCC